MGSSELEILEIISSVGQARSLYIEAIQEAKSKNYGQCNELVRKGNEQYAKGHRIHQRLVQEEAGGNPVDLNLLLTHAQDLLMSAESHIYCVGKSCCSCMSNIYNNSAIIFLNIFSIVGCFRNYTGKTFHSV